MVKRGRAAERAKVVRRNIELEGFPCNSIDLTAQRRRKRWTRLPAQCPPAYLPALRRAARTNTEYRALSGRRDPVRAVKTQRKKTRRGGIWSLRRDLGCGGDGPGRARFGAVVILAEHTGMRRGDGAVRWESLRGAHGEGCS